MSIPKTGGEAVIVRRLWPTLGGVKVVSYRDTPEILSNGGTGRLSADGIVKMLRLSGVLLAPGVRR